MTLRFIGNIQPPCWVSNNKIASSLFVVILFNREDGGDMFHWNVSWFVAAEFFMVTGVRAFAWLWRRVLWLLQRMGQFGNWKRGWRGMLRSGAVLLENAPHPGQYHAKKQRFSWMCKDVKFEVEWHSPTYCQPHNGSTLTALLNVRLCFEATV
jgi:hypothetical protein